MRARLNRYMIGGMEHRPAAPRVRSPWFLTSPPPQPDGMIERPRLHTRVDAALDAAHLAALAAPTGFGKTVLLSTWSQQHAGLTGWLTLTRHEQDDEELLLLGILATIEQVIAAQMSTDEIPVLRTAPPLEGARDLIGRIASTIDSIDSPVTVLIDDAHHVGRVIGDGSLDTLIRLTGGRLRFIVAGSAHLEQRFSRQISTHAGILLTAEDLAMTVDETHRHAVASGREIDAEAHHLATGGWPIALVLHDPSAGRQDARLADHLESHVLSALPARVGTIVIESATCDRVDAKLVESLTGDSGAATLLDECASNSLFLAREVEDGDIVYRWRSAITEACRTILRRSDPERARELDGIAARALARQAPVEALRHAVRSEDATLLHELIRESWLRMIVETGARSLQDVCVTLPSPLIDEPEVMIIRACCLNLLGDHANARLLAANAIARGSGEAFRATCAFAQLFLQDDEDRLVSAADEAQQLLEGGDGPPAMLPYRLFLVGWTLLRLRRRPQDAVALLQAAVQEARATRRPLLEQRAASNLLFALAYGGALTAGDRLRAVTQLEDDAHDEWYGYDGGIGLFALGFSEYWRADLDNAEMHLRALASADDQDTSYSALARVYLVFIAAARRNPRELRDARHLLSGISAQDRHGVPWSAYRTIARATLLAASGQVDDALALIDDLRRGDSIPAVRVVAAEIARRAGRPALAMELLGGLGNDERRVSYIAASAETTAALIAFADGEEEVAQARLGRALDAADREDVRLPFLTAGEALHPLLVQQAISGEAHSGFIAARLAELSAADSTDVGSPLSSREREIYGYLSTAMTAAEIAAALFVSVNTVRTHQRAIYRKLGVANRREAVNLQL